MNKEERLAKDITNAVGGNHNIDNIIHCMTRVRIKFMITIKLITMN